MGRVAVSKRSRSTAKAVKALPDNSHLSQTHADSSNPAVPVILKLVYHCNALRGLYNLGHTCFMNAILQAIYRLFPLQCLFIQQQQMQSGQKSDDRFSLGIATMHLFIEMLRPSTPTSESVGESWKPVAPKALLLALWRTHRRLSGYEQQDAHEFFLALVDALHQEENTRAGGKSLHSGHQPCDCCIHSRVFDALLESCVECPNCHTRSSLIESAVDLSLGMAPTVREALQEYFACERLATADYFCGECRGHYAASKTLSWHRLPLCLVLHLKRHGGSSKHHHHNAPAFVSKNDSFIDFPLTLFLVDPQNEEGTVEYSLRAVVVHVGSGSHGGHYYTYVTHRGTWFRMDDSLVLKVELTEVLQCKAYMLFYQRIPQRGSSIKKPS